jgi:hypothetical protein
MEKGIPRYLIKKVTSWQGNRPVTNSTCSSEHRIGASWHLPGLQLSPELCLKMVRMVRAI